MLLEMVVAQELWLNRQSIMRAKKTLMRNGRLGLTRYQTSRLGSSAVTGDIPAAAGLAGQNRSIRFLTILGDVVIAGLTVLLTGSTCLLYLSDKWPNYSTPGLVLRVIGSVVLSVVAGLVVLVYS